jgi:hypothetical protein
VTLAGKAFEILDIAIGGSFALEEWLIVVIGSVIVLDVLETFKVRQLVKVEGRFIVVGDLIHGWLEVILRFQMPL